MKLNYGRGINLEVKKEKRKGKFAQSYISLLKSTNVYLVQLAQGLRP